MNERYDAALLGILQSCGELEPFLDVILGFLYRKTDFFLPLTSDQSMGFPPGAAKEKLNQVFSKYEKLSEESQTAAKLPRSPETSGKQPLTPPVTPGLSQSKSGGDTQEGEPMETSESKEEEKIQGDWTTATWDHHNGGFTEKYAWSQTAQDVEFKLALPNTNVRASDLRIDIKPRQIKVEVKSEKGPEMLLQEKLHSVVKPEDSVWSFHKENKPHDNHQTSNKQHIAPTTARWNQKFSSLAPAPKKKAPSKDKPQRVRGPAIHWSADTLFNTADEAKAFITHDNKWKFRYSHQTTEGKKVYYQCTQRAKLGCGALCHVVYHHSGTALLYTNGEPHNHIEYNTLLGRNPATNVAIDFSKTAIIQATPVTTILGLTPLALTRPLSPKTTTTTSSNTPSTTQIIPVTPAAASPPTPTSATSSPSSAAARNREDWTPVTMFSSYDDAKEFLEQEALWKFSYSHSGASGRKVFYECIMKAKEGCPARIQLLYHADCTTVSYLVNGSSHKHSTDEVSVAKRRGLSNSVREAILEAYDNGFTDTKLVTKYLQIRGLEPPSASKIKVFLNKHRPNGYDNAPISMLQWPFAQITGKDEEAVMGEVTAKC